MKQLSITASCFHYGGLNYSIVSLLTKLSMCWQLYSLTLDHINNIVIVAS